MHHAILNGKTVVPADTMQWAKWFENNDRHVAQDHIDGVKVSTAFIGINLGTQLLPKWFETMVFGGKYDGHQERYATWREAEHGHTKILAMIEGVRFRRELNDRRRRK